MFYVSLDQFNHVLLAFVVLRLVSSVSSQEIGWEERLRNDLFCVEWDVKPYLNQSNLRFVDHPTCSSNLRVYIDVASSFAVLGAVTKTDRESFKETWHLLSFYCLQINILT